MMENNPIQFKPLDNIKASQRVELEIKKAIIEGRLRLGDKLPPEIELSQQFRVGRSTVREAISSLSKLGIIEVKKGPGQGAFISGNLPKMLIENLELFMGLHDVPLDALIEARITLESATAELAALRADDEDLKRIEDTLSVSANDKKNIDFLVESSFNFHLALATVANNPIITYFIVSVKDLLHQCISQTVLLRKDPAESIREHEQIYRAIKEKNSVQARQLMLNHLENYRNRIRELDLHVVLDLD